MKRPLVVLLALVAMVLGQGAWLGNVPTASGTNPDIPKLSQPRVEQTPAVLRGGTRDYAAALPYEPRFDANPRPLREMILEPTDNPDETLFFDQRLYSGLGLGTTIQWYAGVRFTPAVGCTLKSVLFYQYEQPTENGYVYVFDQNDVTSPGPVLESVPYSLTGTGWKNIALTTPLVLPANRDFWLGVRLRNNTLPQTYPMGFDNLPPGVELRSMFYTVNRTTWYDLSGSYGSWNLRAVIAPLPPGDDMGAISFDGVAATQRPEQWVTIKTTVKNFGLNTQNSGVPVRFRIDGPGGYVFNDNDQATLTSLAYNGTEQITFTPQWRTPNTNGTYTLKAWTELSGDANRENDTVRMTVVVTNWLFYADFNTPAYYTWATPEKGTMIFPNEFGASYPLQLESLKAVFYLGAHVWRDSTFRFKVYGNDLSTVLYTSPWMEAVPPSGGGAVEVKHYLSTPVSITSGIFLIAVDCYGDSGYPDLLADGVPRSRSVYGDPSQWYYWPYGELMVAGFVDWGAPDHDVGFTNIRNPWMYTEPGAGITPRGVVYNYGTMAEAAVPCSCWVVDTVTDTRVYSGYASVPTLGAGDTATVTFPLWTPPGYNNVYQVIMVTYLATDENRSNDGVGHVFMGFHVNDALFSPLTTSSVTLDGVINAAEWEDGTRYDVSNILGRSDPYYRYFPGNVFVHLMHDTGRFYLACDLPFQTANDSFELGLYFDENRDGLWAADSSEGNFWPIHRPGASPVDTIVYRSLTSGWRTVATGCVSRVSLASGHMQFEVAVPFGTAKPWLNANPNGDTLGFYMFALNELYTMWLGWWHTLMPADSWSRPSAYFPLILGSPPVVRGDFGASAILAPTGAYDTNAAVAPRATWRNYATVSGDFTAFCGLYDPTDTLRYSQSLSVVGMLPGRDTTITFPDFNVGLRTGQWTVRCSTWSAIDTFAGNDVRTGTFTVSTRPPVGLGWREMQSMPAGAKAAKDGAWLALGDDVIYGAKGNKTPEFYAYYPLADSDGDWTSLTLIPTGTEGKPPSKGCAGVVGDGYVYMTKGNNTAGFWRYSIDSTSWRQLPDVPLGPSMKKVKGGTDLVYVKGTGHDTGWVYLLKGYKNEFFRYNTVTGAWDTTLPPAPVGANGKWDKGSWLALDRNPGHGVYNIYAHKAKYHELWVFDAVTRTWGSAALPGMPLTGMMGKSKKSKDGGCGAYYDNALYALKGGNTQEFWKFNIATRAWTELETIPAVGMAGKKKRVKAGADIVAWGDGLFYALKGNKSLELWRYALPLVAGPSAPSRSGVMAGPTALPFAFSVASPARGAALVNWSLPQSGPARLTVFDIGGRVRAAQALVGRTGTARLALGELGAGVYLVKLEAGAMTATRKLVIE